MRLAALEIPAQPEFVSVARLVVSTIAGDRYEISDDQLESLKLAVSEACVMAIQSRYGNVIGEHVSISCDGTNQRIDITVGCEGSEISQDSVMAHSPGVIEGHDFDAEFGLPLIGSLVDAIEVEERPYGNLLRMTVFSDLAEEL